MRKLPGTTTEEKLLLNRRIVDGCWRWTGCHSRGYGLITINRKSRYVHRVSYSIWIGPIPDGLEIDHLCRIKDCFNPAHLEAVTHQVNVQRVPKELRNKARDTCRAGHPWTDESTYIRPNGKRNCRICIRATANANSRAGRMVTHTWDGDGYVTPVGRAVA